MGQLSAPFPYYGGKARQADAVWRELGSTDCSIEHQVRLNRVIGREGQRRRRARRKQTADAGRGIGGEAGPADGGTDGLGRSLSGDSSGQGRYTPPS